MATLLQSKFVNAGTVASSTLTFNSACTPGSMLVAWVGNANASASLSASDPTNGAYTRNAQSQGNTNTLAICTFPNNASSAALVVTFSESGGGGNLFCCIEEWSGVSASSPFDKSAVNTQGVTTNLTVGPTAATTFANELVLAGFAISNSQTNTAGGSYTQDPNAGSTSGVAGRLGVEYQNVSSTGTYSATFTLGGTSGSATLIATFNTSAPGGTGLYMNYALQPTLAQ
jgi:hypothetical protein